ncbi:reverse transcriptase domain-containing protein [Tanacetum coccineum]
MPVCLNPYPAGLFTDPTGSVTPFVRWIEEYPLPDGLKMPSHVGSYDRKGDLDNFLHLFEGAIRMQKWLMPVACHMFTYTLKDSARIWWNSQKAGSILNYEDLKAKFRSHFSQQKRFTKTHLAVHSIKQREGESVRAFATRYTDDTLQILGLHEDQRIFGFVHGLKARNLVEHLSTDLPSTYKGLMEKTYTWIEAREVATNGAPNDQRDNFKRSRKSSWDNGRGQRSRDRFSPYWGPNHGLLSSLSKSPREILATEKVARSFEQPPRMLGSRRSRDMSKFCYFHEDHGHDTNDCRQLRSQIEEAVRSGQLSHLVKGIKKERTKTSDSQWGKKKEKSTTPAEAPILMINHEEARIRNNISKSPTFDKREITFPPVTKGNNSLALVIIKAKIFGREVGRVHIDSSSSCEVIYEHHFLKLKPSIQASKVDSQVPLVRFSREKSWAIGEVLLEITIGNAPLTRSETLNFIIVRSNSPYSTLLGRTTMQKMRMKVRETSPENTEGVLSCTDAEEKIIVNIKYPKQTVTIGKKLLERLKERLPSDPNDRRRRGQDNILRRRRSILLSKDALRFRNTGATYQRLVDKVFNDQIGRNLKAYINDIVIKSTSEEDMPADVKDTFQRFRSINMKLNPKKCSFGVEEGPFLGHLITKQGIRANPSKTQEEAAALQEIKNFMETLPTLTAPIHGEVLMMYLAASTKSINAALFARREKGQAHTVAVLTNSSIKQALIKPKKSRRVAKWAIELGEHDIVFQTRDDNNKETPKYFLIEAPPEDNMKEVERKTDTKLKETKLSCEWKLYTDGASSFDGSGTGLMLIDPKGKEYTYALRFKFETMNNEAEYKALLAGLRIAFRVPQIISSKDDKYFKEGIFTDLCRGMKITQSFSPIKEHIEIMGRIEKQLARSQQGWVDDLPQSIISTVESIIAKDGRGRTKEMTKRKESKEVVLIKKAYYQNELRRYHSKRNSPSNYKATHEPPLDKAHKGVRLKALQILKYDGRLCSPWKPTFKVGIRCSPA